MCIRDRSKDLVAASGAGVVVQEALGGEGAVRTGGQVFTLHAVVGEAGGDVEVVQQIAEGVFHVGGAVHHAHAAGTVIATQDVGHDGVLLGIGDVDVYKRPGMHHDLR